MQPQGQIGDLPGRPGGRVARAGAALTQLRRHDLLDQVGLAVRGRLDRTQVPGLHAVLVQRGDRPGDRERVPAVLPAHPADQAVILELGQFRVADVRGVEQLVTGQAGRGPLGAVGLRLIWASLAAVGEPFPDHPQRQVRIPLHGEDVPQPGDVGRGEPAVARVRPGRLDQPFCLQETDLRGADIRKFRAQLSQHLADTELATR